MESIAHVLNRIQFKFQSLFVVDRNMKPQKCITLCLEAVVCCVKVSKSHSFCCHFFVISFRNTECSDVVSSLKGIPNNVVVLFSCRCCQFSVTYCYMYCSVIVMKIFAHYHLSFCSNQENFSLVRYRRRYNTI